MEIKLKKQKKEDESQYVNNHSNDNDTENKAPQQKLTWLGVVGMGVAFSISGNFSGWNVGLGIGGWGGMFFAALIMACYYFLLSQCLAELATTSNHIDGMDSLAEVGLGNAGKYFTGMSIAIAVGLSVGAAVSFIEAYSFAVMGVGGIGFKCILIAIIAAILLRGAKETALLTMLGSSCALIILIIFCIVLFPHVTLAGLYTNQNGSSHIVLDGMNGIWLCIPYALFMSLGVEQAANAACDMNNPKKNLPKALLTAVAIVLLIGLSVLLFSTAGDLHKVALAEGNPLFIAIMNNNLILAKHFFATLIGAGSIISLLATVFSLFYTSSRQFFSLGKSGFIPSIFSKQNSKFAPSVAIVVVALLALVGSYIDPNIIVISLVFCLSIGNLIVLISFLIYRYKRNFINRSYVAIGGVYSAILAALLILVVLIACAQLQVSAVKYIAIGYLMFIIYYFMRKQHLQYLK